jgi:hypothetical protein
MSHATISKQAALKAAATRPGDYMAVLRSHAVRETETHLIFRRKSYETLCELFRDNAKQPLRSASLAAKARNFATSAAKHLASGMPRASDEEIARRFAICQACEHFDGKACRQCGCPVVREKKFLSKLSWANEKCPVGKWGPVSG